MSARTAILRLESRRRVRSSLVLSGLFVLLGAFYISIYPGFAEDAEDIVEAFPEFMLEMLGIDALHTIEGFIAAELYSVFWVLLVGAYFAALGAGLIARDVDTRRLDLTLSYPVSRESVLLQKVAALWLPLLVLNVAVAAVVFVGPLFVGESIDPVAVTMVHLLSVPYLLVCVGIGLAFSVTTNRARTARSGAIGAVILLWIVETVSTLDESVEWVGDLTPSRYYHETAILVHEEYAVGDALLLTAVFVVLLVACLARFVRRDI